MKVFHCDHCGHLLFFENTQCVRCGQLVAYLPDLTIVGSLDPNNDADNQQSGTWRSPLKAAAGRAYRLCRNYEQEQVCNWAIAEGDANALCVSCRLTRIIPDLTRGQHRQAWYRLELAKRRLLFELAELGLPIVSWREQEGGLAFDLLSSAREPVTTGHADGVITLDLNETDSVERETRRQQLDEPYRTVLGHMRHEIAHYYQPILAPGATPEREQCRRVFGDDREDYQQAIDEFPAMKSRLLNE